MSVQRQLKFVDQFTRLQAPFVERYLEELQEWGPEVARQCFVRRVEDVMAEMEQQMQSGEIIEITFHMMACALMYLDLEFSLGVFDDEE